MYNFLTKNGQFLAFGIGLLITIIFIFSIFSGLEDFNAYGPKDEARFGTTIFNFGIGVTVAMVALAGIAMIIFILINTITSLTSGGAKGMIGILIAVAVFVVCYLMATPLTDGALSEYTQKFNVSEGASRFISGAVNASVIMCLIALASFVLAEIRNLFK